LRVSKNAIINLHKVHKVHTEKRMVYLDGNKEYPVSVRKMKELTIMLNKMTVNEQNVTLN